MLEMYTALIFEIVNNSKKSNQIHNIAPFGVFRLQGAIWTPPATQNGAAFLFGSKFLGLGLGG